MLYDSKDCTVCTFTLLIQPRDGPGASYNAFLAFLCCASSVVSSLLPSPGQVRSGLATLSGPELETTREELAKISACFDVEEASDGEEGEGKRKGGEGGRGGGGSEGLKKERGLQFTV